jgi:hypothetical protein
MAGLTRLSLKCYKNEFQLGLGRSGRMGIFFPTLVQASSSDAAKPQPSFLMWKRVSGICRWEQLTQVHTV